MTIKGLLHLRLGILDITTHVSNQNFVHYIEDVVVT